MKSQGKVVKSQGKVLRSQGKVVFSLIFRRNGGFFVDFLIEMMVFVGLFVEIMVFSWIVLRSGGFFIDF